ncbi:MAG: hypothetical protein AAB466_14160 [Verrucomicrobiota bacterium]
MEHQAKERRFAIGFSQRTPPKPVANRRSILRTERGTLSELMEKIKAGRKDVQLAADSEGPASDKANAGTRQEFRLPLNRSLKA